MLEKVLDLKNTFEGKFIAVFMSAVLVLTMSNFAAFADSDATGSSKDAPVAEQPVAADKQDQPAAEQSVTEPVAPAPQETPAAESTTASTDADKQAVEETVEHGTEAAASDGDAPTVNAPIASTEVGEAVVTFETENAYVAIKSVEDQILYGKTLTTELHKELKFVASADPGYEVSEIKAQNAANADVAVTTQDGVSTIAADDVDSTLVVTVKAKAIESEEPPATETTPITGDTKIEAGESAVENDAPNKADEAADEKPAVNVIADGLLNGSVAPELQAPVEKPATYSVRVNFLYGNGSLAEQPYAVQRAATNVATISLPVPEKEGYTASVSELDAASGSASINDGGYLVIEPTGASDIEVTVSYSSARAPYTVRHMFQNVDPSDGAGVEHNGSYYTEDASVAQTLEGEVAMMTSAQGIVREGFSQSAVTNAKVEGDGSTEAFVYYDRHMYTVSYDAGAGTVEYRYGQDVTVSDPERLGYDFAGWSFANERGESVTLDQGTMPAYNLTASAQWTEASAQYEVAVWVQNANDDGYSYIENMKLEDATGSTVGDEAWLVDNEAAIQKAFADSVGGESKYYSFNEAKSVENPKVIAGNGTTTVNVYFDRNVYSIKFYYARVEASGNSGRGMVQTAENTYGSVLGANWQPRPAVAVAALPQGDGIDVMSDGNSYYYYLLEAKYGENISSKWPSKETRQLDTIGAWKFISWGTQSGSGYYDNHDNPNIKGVYSTMSSELIIEPAEKLAQSMVAYGKKSGISNYTYEIYYKSLDGSKYENVAVYENIRSTDPGSGQNALSFPGVSFEKRVCVDGDKTYGGTVQFYYTRNDVEVSLKNVNADYVPSKVTDDMKAQGIRIENGKLKAKYGSDISCLTQGTEGLSYPFERGTKSWDFSGWCLDPAGEIPYFNGAESRILGEESVVLYAGWKAPTYDISFNLDGGSWSDGSKKTKVQEVSEGDSAVDPGDPQKDGYTFGGWYASNGTKFFFSNGVYDDAKLKARWIPNVETYAFSIVCYDAENGKDITALVKDQSTLSGAAAAGEAVSIKAPMIEKYAPSQGVLVKEIVQNNQTIVINYYPATTYQYTVEYVDESGASIKDDRVLDVVYQEIVEDAADIPGYTPLEVQLSHAWSEGANNTIRFVYSQDKYTITYAPGNFGAFKEQTTTDLVYGDRMPVFNGDVVGQSGTRFEGWLDDSGIFYASGEELPETVTGNVIYTAQWVKIHDVTYSWTGLPEGGKLYDENGVELARPSVPESVFGVAEGERFTVDASQTGTVVYTQDEFGNQTARYTLEAWSLEGEQVMGDADVAITATWTKEPIEVKTWKVTYRWKGDVPSDGYAQLIPSVKTYKNNEPYFIDTYYHKGFTVMTYDGYGNATGVYTFGGWNEADGIARSDVKVVGEWTYKETQVAQHNVTYAWTGLPEGQQLYDADGHEMTPEYPNSITGLVKGQSYTIDAEKPGMVVYTHDEFGNKNASYTLGAWADPGKGKMGDADVEVTGVWTAASVAVPEWSIEYNWTGDVPAGAYAKELPSKETYKNNQPYTIDSNYYNGYTVTTKDDYGNDTGFYKFSGWDAADGRITGNIKVSGKWEYVKTDVVPHNVLYHWEGLPEDETLYDQDGNVVKPSKPASITGLVRNQNYAIDESQVGMVVYTHDEFGNQNASYTLGAWSDPNNGVMGEADVTVEARWEVAPIDVPTYGVTYDWTGDVPSGEYARILPVDSKQYKNNEPYAVDSTFKSGYTVSTYDDYGNVNGAYTFSGWNKTGGPVTGPVEVSGEWKFTETTVAKYNVTYSWTGLPTNVQLYDAAGNAVAPTAPSSLTGLVNNQKFTVDESQTGMVVYTHDEFDNVDASYTLGAWSLTGQQVMGEDHVEIQAKWKKDSVTVPTWTVTYTWDGDVPEGDYARVLPIDGKEYKNNAPFAVDKKFVAGYEVPTYDEFDNVNGAYVFGGWDRSDGPITGNIMVSGTWTYQEAEVAKHNVSYAWTGLPEGQQLYDEAGNPVEPSVPASITGLVRNQGYTVDASQVGTVVYTHDAYGNRTASYTLGAWSDPNNGTMGEADVTVTATWTPANIDVTAYPVTYIYEGNVPANAPALPSAGSYVPNQPVSIAASPTVEGYAFGGWNRDNFLMPASPVVIAGTWTADFANLSAKGIGKVYNGVSSSIEVTGTVEGDTVRYYVDGVEVDNSFIKVSQSSSVTVEVTRGNQTWTRVVDVAITPAELTVSTAGASKVYDAEPLTAEGYSVTGLVAEETLIARTTGTVTDVTTGDGVDNTYELDWANEGTTAEEDNYAVVKESLGKLVVIEGEFAVEAAGYVGVYDGQPHGISVVAPEDATVIFDTDNAYVNVTTSAVTVGYTVSRPNYREVTGSQTVLITPAPVTIMVNDASKVFGAADPDFTGTVSELVAAGDLGEINFVRASGEENVGVYPDALSALYTPNANYTVKVVGGTFEITPQAISADEPTDVIYNGQEQKWVPAVTDPNGNVLIEGVDYTVSYSEDATNAGTVTVVITGMGNYAGVVERTYEIAPAEVVIRVNDASKAYGADDPALSGAVEGLFGNDKLGDVAYSRTGDDEAVGSYADVLTAEVANANPNYTYTIDPGSFTIVPAGGNVVRVDASGLTKVYDGQAVFVTANADQPGSTLLYSLDGSTWSEENPSFVNAGTYTVYVKATNPNYDETAAVSANVVINRAPVTITVADATKVVGAADPEFTGTVAGLVAEGDLGAIGYSRANDAETAGVYADVLVAAYTENPNYAVTVVPGTFAITAAAVTPVPTPTPGTPTAPTVTPVTPTAPTPTPLPTPGTPPADNPLTPIVTPVVDALAGVAEAVIGDNETPLAQGENRETEIADNGTPLAGRDHVNCWVHFYIILGIIVTAIYGACVALRRSLFSRKLKGYENNLTGGDPAPGAPAGKENDAPAAVSATIPVGATMAAGLSE